MKLLSTLALGLFFAFQLSSQTCGVLYVTPTGSGTGTPSDPTSLTNALTSASPNDIIRLAIGTYNVDNPLNLLADVTLEGGFDPGNGWSKTSLAGATTINRTTLNPEGSVNATRLVAFYGNGISNFRLQDLTITTDDAVLNGCTTYGVHLNNCSDYTIARCQITSGNGGDGIDGVAGSNGLNGAIGGNGTNADYDDDCKTNRGGFGGNGAGTLNGASTNVDGSCYNSGQNGGSGGLISGRNGGGGGAGGSAGSEDYGGGNGGAGGNNNSIGTGGSGNGGSGSGNCSSVNGTNGGNGLSGASGSNGSNAPLPTHSGGFFQVGFAGNGADGTGGQGGAGGGGGGGQGCFFCVDGTGGAGGGGGGGGQGGQGGTGASSGGGSFAVYLVNNGLNTEIVDCNVMSGAPGTAGVGGTGGTGGTGGSGGSGGVLPAGGSTCEVGAGGNGGNGGQGGAGGNGGNGWNGVANAIFLNSGNPLSTDISSFNLAAQPVIIKDGINCMNKTTQFESPSLPIGVPGAGVGIANWDFDVYSNGANPATGINNPDTTIYNAAGRYSISLGTDTYEGFVMVTPEQTVDAGLDLQICDANIGTLAGTSSGTDILWSSLGAATIDDATSLNSGVQNLQPGENKFVLNANGCCPAEPDTVTLMVGSSNTGVDVLVECDSYTWIDGNTYTSDNNTATFTLTNVSGCDSLVTLDLTINNSTTGTDVQTACDSYTWIDGNTYSASNNTATYVLTNAAGCDSTVTLDLTINYSTTGTDVQTACDSYTWIDGNTYTSSNNTATHVLTNAVGCDSTVTLDLTINNSTTGTDVQTACDSYTWIDGNTYTASNNTATYVLTNAAGCDSTVTLDLTINYSTTGTDVQTACDSYTWIDGNTYTSSNNTATHVLTNSAGCDSTITLDLTINNSTTGTDTQVACDSYTWIDGNTYTASNNTATHVLTNAAGCDSTVTLDLTINNSTTGTDTQVACDSYTWIDGNTYTASNNTATHVLTNAVGCDSTVTLDLTINNSTTGTDTQVACDSYTWIDGNTYTASNNTATHVLTNAVGCDSTVTLDLTINYSTTGTDIQSACESFTWIDGNTYTSSNNTATYTLTNAVGCDSIVTLDLTIASGINTNVDLVVNSTNDLVLIAAASNAQYMWLDCDDNFSEIPIQNNQTYLVTENGNYAVRLTVGQCTDTSSCITVNNVSVNKFDLDEVSIYPNPTTGIINVDLGDLTNVSIQVLNPMGQLIMENNNITNSNYQFELSGESGMYIMKVQSNGKELFYKIIKE